ncbi:hypothetical protein Nmel_012440 [Mimus melanotis]
MESSLPGLLEERQAVNPFLSPTLLLPATTTPIWAEEAASADDPSSYRPPIKRLLGHRGSALLQRLVCNPCTSSTPSSRPSADTGIDLFWGAVAHSATSAFLSVI